MTLAAWLAQENVSPAVLANRLGVARQTVYCWMTGDFGPSRKHLVQLGKITDNKVTVHDFDLLPNLLHKATVRDFDLLPKAAVRDFDLLPNLSRKETSSSDLCEQT
jgi:DNA-binding XRE family transcriptional regulator